MKKLRERALVCLGSSLLALAPLPVLAQSLVLDPMSASLPGIPATPGDILAPATPIPAPPPPLLSISAAEMGLLPGDVIDAISYGNDGPPGPTLTFSVTRPSVGLAAGPFTPDVPSEVLAVPPGIQPEAAGDLFTTLDPTCGVGPGAHTQILDGNGMILAGPPLTCYPPLGAGLTELLPLPGPPLNDDITAFEWHWPGAGRFTGIGFSLAAGSPSLTPGTNPLLPGGAEPGDVIVTLPVIAPAMPPPLFIFTGAAALGLVSGGPGCAPPACDDVDALSISFPAGGTHLFSIAPGSPSLAGCGYSPADALGGAAPPIAACAPPFFTAAVLDLGPGDDVDALESFVNACPIAPGADLPLDGDGINGMICDNCPAVFNPDQGDSDFDGPGDACDPCTDIDGDGFGNPDFPNACPLDLCPFTPGPNVDTDGDLLADECDNCPLTPNPTQTDTDFDGTGDACDPCPHVSAALPSPLTVKKVLLIYGGTGPGSGDDKPKAIKAEFSTGFAFDPDATEDVHVTFSDADTPPTLFTAELVAGPPWTQLGTAPDKWKYNDPTAPTGVKLVLIKEDPSTPGDYTLKMIGKFADVAGPLVGGAVTTTIEIESGGVGVCFSGVNAVCTSSAAKDKCL